MRDPGLGQPRRQRQKALRRGRKTAPTPIEPCGRTQSAGRPRSPYSCTVQSRASSMQRLHRAPSQDKAAGATTQKTGALSYGLRARRPNPPRPWRQSKVRLGHPIKLILGLETPRGKRPLHRPPAQIARFIHQGCAQTHENSSGGPKGVRRDARLSTGCWPATFSRKRGEGVASGAASTRLSFGCGSARGSFDRESKRSMA